MNWELAELLNAQDAERKKLEEIKEFVYDKPDRLEKVLQISGEALKENRERVLKCNDGNLAEAFRLLFSVVVGMKPRNKDDKAMRQLVLDNGYAARAYVVLNMGDYSAPGIKAAWKKFVEEFPEYSDPKAAAAKFP
jgi:hypothetical protein